MGYFRYFPLPCRPCVINQRVNVMNHTMLFKVLDPTHFYPFYQFSMHRELYVYENMEQKQVCKKGGKHTFMLQKSSTQQFQGQETYVSSGYTTDPARQPTNKMLQGDAPPLMLVGLGNPIDYRYWYLIYSIHIAYKTIVQHSSTSYKPT